MVLTPTARRSSGRRLPLLAVLALVLALPGWIGVSQATAAPASPDAAAPARFQDDDDDGGGDDGDDGDSDDNGNGGGNDGGGDDGGDDDDDGDGGDGDGGGGGGDDDGDDDDDGDGDDDDGAVVTGSAASGPIVDADGDPTTDGYRAAQAIVRLRDQTAIEGFNLRQGTATLAALPERGLYLVGYATGESDEAVLARFAADPGVEWVELNHLSQAPEGRPGYLFVSDEPDPDGAPAYTDDLLGLGRAHGCASGGGIVVAVLDSGVDAGHPALAGRVLSRGYNALDGTNDVSDLGNALDDDADGMVDEMVGHGTHVAGIVLQVAPAATILPVKVLDSDGVGNAFLLAEGIYYAIEEGAAVINLSLSSTIDARVVEDAIAAADAAGIVVVAAAGNANRADPPEYPAAHPAALAVAATGPDDHKSEFSNFGGHVALSAPGTGIPSTLPGGGYGRWSGTSMATAFVAGTAALLLAEDTALLPGAVRDRLVATAASLDALNPGFAGALGAGRLNVATAVGCAG